MRRDERSWQDHSFWKTDVYYLRAALSIADDTNIYLSHNDIDSLQTQAEHENIKISNWVNINKLTIGYITNRARGNKNAAVSSFKLSINHNLTEETDNVKYLGVHLDNKLSSKIHIDMITRKSLSSNIQIKTLCSFFHS